MTGFSLSWTIENNVDLQRCSSSGRIMIFSRVSDSPNDCSPSRENLDEPHQIFIWLNSLFFSARAIEIFPLKVVFQNDNDCLENLKSVPEFVFQSINITTDNVDKLFVNLNQGFIVALSTHGIKGKESQIPNWQQINMAWANIVSLSFSLSLSPSSWSRKASTASTLTIY